MDLINVYYDDCLDYEPYDDALGKDKRLSRLRYGDYLKTSHWKERREEFINAHWSGKCNRCHCQVDKPHVHHLTYGRLGNELDLGLCVLCPKCHEQIHARGHIPAGDPDWRFSVRKKDELPRPYYHEPIIRRVPDFGIEVCRICNPTLHENIDGAEREVESVCPECGTKMIWLTGLEVDEP